MISIRDVWFSYPAAAAPAVRAATIDINGGEMVAILGANGSGKSTLARLMNGLLIPRRGDVSVDGYATHEPRSLGEIRRRVGMVFQNPENQIVSSTVSHDVAFGLENLCVAPAQMAPRIGAVLHTVGLTGREDDNPQDLSASEKQRLAIAGALAVEPAYLVLDEATSFLDGADRQDVLATVLRLRDTRTLAVVLITHLMEEALLADRVVVMADGAIVFDGLPGALFALPRQQLAGWQLHVPALVELVGRLRASGCDLPSDVRTADDLVRALCL